MLKRSDRSDDFRRRSQFQINASLVVVIFDHFFGRTSEYLGAGHNLVQYTKNLEGIFRYLDELKIQISDVDFFLRC